MQAGNIIVDHVQQYVHLAEKEVAAQPLGAVIYARTDVCLWQRTRADIIQTEMRRLESLVQRDVPPATLPCPSYA